MIERRIASHGKIGTTLALYVMDLAHREKLSTLWLTVERNNFIAGIATRGDLYRCSRI